MKFGEIRSLVSKTDAISIMLTSTGDVDENYINIKCVPDKYDNMDVVGFGNVNCVHVHGVDCLLHGTEFYLDDTK